MADGVRARAVKDAMVQPYREMTPAAIILGVLQGIVLNLAFVYAALKLGFSIGAQRLHPSWVTLCSKVSWVKAP